MRLPIRLSPLLLPAVLACVLRISPASAQAVGPEFQVNSYTTDRQRLPRIATDAGGNFVVVWQSNTQDGSGIGVFGQRYSSAGAQLGAEFRVNTYATYDQKYPSVASDSGGNFVVVWSSDNQDGDLAGVFGQRYGSAGAPLGVEFLVNTYTTNNQGGSQFVTNASPSVASDSGGNFVVVWSSNTQDGSGYGVFGQRYASSGTPLGVEFRVNTSTIGFQSSPSVASDSGGNFVVVWQSQFQDDSGDGVFGQRYGSAGAPLGAEFRVNTYTTNNQMNPSVASDSGGNFVVVWQSLTQDGGGSLTFGIVGQRYGSTGAPLGAEFHVNFGAVTGLFGQRYPSVANDSGGNFVVVWQVVDYSSYGVFGERYDSTGAPVAAENGFAFQVNTYYTNFQYRPSVAGDSGGNFVVVWDSYTQDGSLDGVFGQRFCSGRPTVTPPAALTATQTLCM